MQKNVLARDDQQSEMPVPVTNRGPVPPMTEPMTNRKDDSVRAVDAVPVAAAGPQRGWPGGPSAIDLRKLLLLAATYSGIMVGAHLGAYLIRFEFQLSVAELVEYRRSLAWMLPLELLSLFVFGQFQSLLSYFSLPDLKRIVAAVFSVGVVSIVVWHLTGGRWAPPRSIILLNFLLDTLGFVSVRLLFRMIRERQSAGADDDASIRRVVIVGAGDVGANLAKEMMLRRDLRMRPVAFVDDDQSKWHTSVHGVPVVGRPEMFAQTALKADEAVIAMPSASGRRVREVVQAFQKLGIKSETVPSFEQMVNGVVKVSHIRPVQIEDLLGRERVSLETDRIRESLQGRIVMVTGAGGSIGSELCRQIVKHGPARLLMVEQAEPSLFEIEQELIGAGAGGIIQPLVADILDGDRMAAIFSGFRPNVVFHAAAHKHVYLMERQPAEAIRNNSVGTRLLAEMASAHGTTAFVMISTDKAINPTSLMGASKRLAEIHLQALQPRTPQTKHMMVRFGNVLGSSGSVIPIFRRQIAAGGPVTVTHPEVIRYFMTIPEAAGLVMQASVLGQGGEIFVLDMGQPMKILDLARQMISLSGLREDDIEIKFTGLKPGEKLFEELQHRDERYVATQHPRIMKFQTNADARTASEQSIAALESRLYQLSDRELKQRLMSVVPEYQAYLG